MAGFLKSRTVFMIDVEHAFASTSDNIRLPTIEVLLCTAVGDLINLKKLRNWAALDAILLLPFLSNAVVLEGDMVAG